MEDMNSSNTSTVAVDFDSWWETRRAGWNQSDLPAVGERVRDAWLALNGFETVVTVWAHALQRDGSLALTLRDDDGNKWTVHPARYERIDDPKAES